LDVEWASELGVHLWNSKKVIKVGRVGASKFGLDLGYSMS